MLLFVIPRFETLFAAQGANLPALTQIVVTMSRFLQSYWYIVIFGMIAIVITIKQMLKRSRKFSVFVDYLLLKLPVFGTLIKNVIFARITSILSITLTAGVTVNQALFLAEQIVKNSIYSDAISDIKDDVAEGKQMYFSMQVTNLFPVIMTQMVKVGEQTGTTKEILAKVAMHYEEEVESTVNNLNSLLEPVVLALLGGIVAVMVISMYLPIFKLGAVF